LNFGDERGVEGEAGVRDISAYGRIQEGYDSIGSDQVNKSDEEERGCAGLKLG
jgi:hypothetical protein